MLYSSLLRINDPVGILQVHTEMVTRILTSAA